MTRLLVDVYEADGQTRVGRGPLRMCTEASVKRKLDGAGTLTLNFPATDDQARTHLTNERLARVFFDEEVQGEYVLRELGRCVIRDRDVDVSESGAGFVAKGPDSMDALTRRTVRLQRKYSNQTMSTIASDLIALVPGWSVTFEDAATGALLQSARYAGATILKALLRLVEERGLHLREDGTNANRIEIGAFGQSSGVTVTNISSITREAHENDDVVFISTIHEGESSQELYNRVYPLGAGEGQAALTLRYSTRSSPYAIQSVVESDGSTTYSIEDSDSQDDFGIVETVVTFKEVGPVSNSENAKVFASNALYDAATAWMQRRLAPQRTYKVKGVKPRTSLQPGDKIRLVYKGQVWRDNVAVDVLDVDAHFWLLSLTERVNDSGLALDLEVSAIDKPLKKIADLVAEKLEAVDVRNLAIATFPTFYTDTFYDYIECLIGDTGRNANFVFRPAKMLTEVSSIKLAVRSYPLYTFVQVNSQFQAAGTNFDYAFNISESDQHPRGLRIFINDVEYTSALGGPWNPLGTPPDPAPNEQIDVELDITEIVQDTGLDEEFRIMFRATFDPFGPGNRVPGYTSPNLGGVGSSGVLQCSVRVLGVAQAIIPE